MMPTCLDIVATARLWIGTPFHHQGRLPFVGLDCCGLVACVASVNGVPVKDCTAYRRRPDGTLIDRLAAALDPIPIERMGPGDIIAFWAQFGKRREPYHIGFHAGYTIIHTYADVGRVVEHVWSDDWRARVHSAWRLRGVIHWEAWSAALLDQSLAAQSAAQSVRLPAAPSTP